MIMGLRGFCPLRAPSLVKLHRFNPSFRKMLLCWHFCTNVMPVCKLFGTMHTESMSWKVSQRQHQVVHRGRAFTQLSPSKPRGSFGGLVLADSTTRCWSLVLRWLIQEVLVPPQKLKPMRTAKCWRCFHGTILCCLCCFRTRRRYPFFFLFFGLLKLCWQIGTIWRNSYPILVLDSR